jgi:hypothetical protein
MESLTSASHFEADIALEDTGVAKIHMYSDNRLHGGVALVFSRNGNTLRVQLESDKETEDVSDRFKNVQAGASFKVRVDMHNNEEPNAHVLVWMQAVDTYNSKTALFDSEAHAAKNHGQGKGVYWGMTLEKAAASNLTQGKALYQHGHEEPSQEKPQQNEPKPNEHKEEHKHEHEDEKHEKPSQEKSQQNEPKPNEHEEEHKHEHEAEHSHDPEGGEAGGCGGCPCGGGKG